VKSTSIHCTTSVLVDSVLVDGTGRWLVCITSPRGGWRGIKTIKTIVKPSIVNVANRIRCGFRRGRRDHVFIGIEIAL
jgi:hypothetical protein